MGDRSGSSDRALVWGTWYCPICERTTRRPLVADGSTRSPPEAFLLAGLKTHLSSSQDPEHGGFRTMPVIEGELREYIEIER